MLTLAPVGYGRSGGTKTSAAELASLFKSLEDNELLIPGRLLTGQYRLHGLIHNGDSSVAIQASFLGQKACQLL
jgi:hypothetical protein